MLSWWCLSNVRLGRLKVAVAKLCSLLHNASAKAVRSSVLSIHNIDSLLQDTLLW